MCIRDRENNMLEARRFVSITAVIILSLLVVTDTKAQADLSPELRGKIDKLVNDALARSGVPSASIAVVKDGKIVYLNAYGSARLEPKTPATSEMRYSIGSVSYTHLRAHETPEHLV